MIEKKMSLWFIQQIKNRERIILFVHSYQTCIPTNNLHTIGGGGGGCWGEGGLEAEYNPCHKLQSNQTPMWTFNNIEILIYSMLICPFRNMSPCCWYWVLISDCCGTNTRAPLCPVDWTTTFWQSIGYRPHSGRVLVIDGEDLPAICWPIQSS